MYTVLIIIQVIVSIVLVVSVLLQVGKGATMGSTFGGTSSQTLFGSSGPTNILVKITAVCAVIFMATSLYLTYLSKKQSSASIMSTIQEEPAKPLEAQPVAPEGTAPQSAPAKAP